MHLASKERKNTKKGRNRPRMCTCTHILMETRMKKTKFPKCWISFLRKVSKYSNETAEIESTQTSTMYNCENSLYKFVSMWVFVKMWGFLQSINLGENISN